MALLDWIGLLRLRSASAVATGLLLLLAVPTPGSAQDAPATHVATGGRPPTAAPSGAGLVRHGAFTPLPDVPGATATGYTGLNNRGTLVGVYSDDANRGHGFTWHPRRGFTTFDAAPRSVTFPFDTNDKGQVVGGYYEVDTLDGLANSPPGSAHGFVREPNGTVRTIDVPDAQLTIVFGINNRGHMVGTYVDQNGFEHGFRLGHGRFTTIDPPGASPRPFVANTHAVDINDRGQIVGFSADDQGTYHGFLLDRGVFTTVDPPGAADVPQAATTAPWGIDNRGRIVGQYVDSAGILHGYLRGQDGRFRVVDHPLSNSIAADIDDRGRILVPAPGSAFKGRVPPVGG